MLMRSCYLDMSLGLLLGSEPSLERRSRDK